MKPEKRSIPLNRAINATKAEAARLAREHPDIADEYRNGSTTRSIAEKYLRHLSGVSDETPRLVVSQALALLLSEEELSLWRLAHRRTAGHRIGEERLHTRTGIFSDKKTYDTLRETPLGELTEREYIERRRDELAGSGSYWKQITDEVNNLYGHNRTPHQVNAAYFFWKKHQSQEEPPSLAPTSSAQS